MAYTEGMTISFPRIFERILEKHELENFRKQRDKLIEAGCNIIMYEEEINSVYLYYSPLSESAYNQSKVILKIGK